MWPHLLLFSVRDFRLIAPQTEGFSTAVLKAASEEYVCNLSFAFSLTLTANMLQFFVFFLHSMIIYSGDHGSVV